MQDEDLDILNIEDNKYKYASDVEKIEYLTNNIKNINSMHFRYLSSNVDRPYTITKFANILKDIETAIRIEAGIYEFTLVYITTKNYNISLMPAIYMDKVNELVLNLDESSVLQNQTFKTAIQNHAFNPQIAAFMKPQDVHPIQWQELVRKNNLRDEKKKNMAVTDLYQCYKCKGRRCRMMEMQTRSSDEPMTKFITCLDCYHVMKR